MQQQYSEHYLYYTTLYNTSLCNNIMSIMNQYNTVLCNSTLKMINNTV
jgi:hypothetical protein